MLWHERQRSTVRNRARRTSSSQPNGLSSSLTTSSWPQHSSPGGPSSSRERTSWEQTCAATLPNVASWLLRSAYGLLRSCVDRRLKRSLAGGLAEQENRVRQGQQWHGRCECAVPLGLPLRLRCPWHPFRPE